MATGKICNKYVCCQEGTADDENIYKDFTSLENVFYCSLCRLLLFHDFPYPQPTTTHHWGFVRSWPNFTSTNSEDIGILIFQSSHNRNRNFSWVIHSIAAKYLSFPWHFMTSGNMSLCSSSTIAPASGPATTESSTRGASKSNSGTSRSVPLYRVSPPSASYFQAPSSVLVPVWLAEQLLWPRLDI